MGLRISSIHLRIQVFKDKDFQILQVINEKYLSLYIQLNKIFRNLYLINIKEKYKSYINIVMTQNDFDLAIIKVCTTIDKFDCTCKDDSLNILMIKYKNYTYGF